MVSITPLVAVLITETVSSSQFVTYILLFAESNAIPLGASPTDIVAITVFSSASISGINCEMISDNTRISKNIIRMRSDRSFS